MIPPSVHGVIIRKDLNLLDLSKSLIPNLRCSTCHLNAYACPGHAGHIELPVPVYNATFMDQLLQLLRARCAYCNHLKMHPAEVHRYICKLQLVGYGLLEEAVELDNIQSNSNMAKIEVMERTISRSDEASSDSSEDELDHLTHHRNTFVQRAIENACGRKQLIAAFRDKIETVFTERRAIIKDFLAGTTGRKTCGSCKG